MRDGVVIVTTAQTDEEAHALLAEARHAVCPLGGNHGKKQVKRVSQMRPQKFKVREYHVAHVVDVLIVSIASSACRICLQEPCL